MKVGCRWRLTDGRISMGGDAEVSDNVTKGGRFGNAKMGKRKKGRKMKRREGSLEEGRNGRR